MADQERPRPRIPPGFELVPEQYAIPEYEAMRIIWDPDWTIRGTYSEALTAIALARGALTTATRIMDEVREWASEFLGVSDTYRRLSEISADVRGHDELLAEEMAILERAIDDMYGRSDWD